MLSHTLDTFIGTINRTHSQNQPFLDILNFFYCLYVACWSSTEDSTIFLWAELLLQRKDNGTIRTDTAIY